MKRSNKLSPEVRERAVRLVQEPHGGGPITVGKHRIHRFQDWLRVTDLERMGQACRGRCRRTRRHHDRRASAQEGTGARVKELRRPSEILKLVSAFFAQVELGRRLKP